MTMGSPCSDVVAATCVARGGLSFVPWSSWIATSSPIMT